MSKNKDAKLFNMLVKAREHHQNGQLSQAMAAYKKILRIAPNQADAWHYLGLAYYQSGNVELAINHIKRATVFAPSYPDALNNLANIHKELGDQQQAYAYYQQVLELDPKHANALINIAVVLRETKQTHEALGYVKRALDLVPNHPVAQHNLANIYTDLREFQLASTAYQRAMQLDPLNQHSQRSYAHVLRELGCTAEAIQVLENIVKQNPGDAIAEHMLASYTGTNIPSRATDQYIKQTFDAFSVNFDLSLAQLKYQAPQLVAEKVMALIDKTSDFAPSDKLSILDIGCGTGLCGQCLRPAVEKLVGVDLSAKMLVKARQLSIYDELHESELCAYMQTTAEVFSCVICADTLVYFGDLAQAFAAVYQVLQAPGLFVFTLEQQRGDSENHNYTLQKNGRYSHQLSYVKTALQAANFMIISTEDMIPRYENGEAVDGALVVVQKM
ncbi:MAG: tetratricopeptide repeat protein [Paraglaciecola sp.]|nr:tetratricopeptide repeat protein [Paraglaciecola sp.]NCT47623.1 tetratricopeptide repeat protein [Paraglaciecola sp.]